MELLTGTWRVDAILSDLPGQPVISLKIVRDEKARVAAGYGYYNLYWPNRGYWRHLGIAHQPVTASLEEFVLEGARKAQRRGLLPAAAQECVILDVWQRIDVP